MADPADPHGYIGGWVLYATRCGHPLAYGPGRPGQARLTPLKGRLVLPDVTQQLDHVIEDPQVVEPHAPTHHEPQILRYMELTHDLMIDGSLSITCKNPIYGGCCTCDESPPG